MFYGCISLSGFQDLKVDTIETLAYSEMFSQCTSLLIPPSLDSKNVKIGGCRYMFNSNNSNKMLYLPPLPMTGINTSCYENMFVRCNSLKSPYIFLPATALSPSCYYKMMSNTNVNYVVVKFTDWNNTYYSTQNWLSGTPTNGDFYKYKTLHITRGISYIPDNWNVYFNDITTKLYFKEPL